MICCQHMRSPWNCPLCFAQEVLMAVVADIVNSQARQRAAWFADIGGAWE